MTFLPEDTSGTSSSIGPTVFNMAGMLARSPLIPLYTIMRRLQLLFSPWALVLSYTTFTIPFSVWLMNGYLNDLPVSLEEAAEAWKAWKEMKQA